MLELIIDNHRYKHTRNKQNAAPIAPFFRKCAAINECSDVSSSLFIHFFANAQADFMNITFQLVIYIFALFCGFSMVNIRCFYARHSNVESLGSKFFCDALNWDEMWIIIFVFCAELKYYFSFPNALNNINQSTTQPQR